MKEFVKPWLCLCRRCCAAARPRTRNGYGASPTASWARGSRWSYGPRIRPRRDQAIDAVLDEMRHIDDSMSTYKPTSEVSQVNAKAADGPMHISKELFDSADDRKGILGHHRGAFDITYASVGYLYDFRKHQRPNEAQIAKALPAVNYRTDPRSEESDGAFLAEGRAHRSRRHRQGLLRRSRHRCAEIARLHARLCRRRRRQPDHRRPLRQALGGRDPRSRARARAT